MIAWSYRLENEMNSIFLNILSLAVMSDAPENV